MTATSAPAAPAKLPAAFGSDVFPDSSLVLTAILSVAGGLLITAALLANLTEGIDSTLFRLIHDNGVLTPATAPAWFNDSVRDLTALGSYTVLTGTVAAMIGFLMTARRLRLAALLAVSSLGALALSNSIKFAVARPRPDLFPQLVPTVSASFPSGHAMLSAAIILTIGGVLAFAAKRPSERRMIVGAAFVVSVCVGLSRLWLGVHWPSDVLAGWCFGFTWAALTLLIAKRIDLQGQPEVAMPPPR
jgi:undecaprenyl-diphosphatase